MAVKVQKQEEILTTPTSTLFPIDELRKRHKFGHAVYAGACAAYGWKTGKVMTENEFVTSITRFCGSPINETFQKGNEVKL